MLIPSSAQKHISVWQAGAAFALDLNLRTLRHLEMLDRNLIGYKHLRDPRDPLYRENAVLLLVCNNLPNKLICDDFFVVGKTVNEGGVA
jgi:hypothetical protein